MIRLKGNVGIQVADYFIPQILDPFVAGVERMRLARKAAISPRRHADQFDPRMLSKIAAHDLGCPVRRAIVHDHPFSR